MKLEFPRQIIKKSSNIKFHENPFSGSRVIPCGETHDGANKLVRFHNIAKAPTNRRFSIILTNTNVVISPLSTYIFKAILFLSSRVMFFFMWPHSLNSRNHLSDYVTCLLSSFHNSPFPVCFLSKRH
jgi:hypothetical protein